MIHLLPSHYALSFHCWILTKRNKATICFPNDICKKITCDKINSNLVIYYIIKITFDKIVFGNQWWPLRPRLYRHSLWGVLGLFLIVVLSVLESTLIHSVCTFRPFYSNVYKRCILLYFFVKSLQTVPFYIGIILLSEPCFGLRARHALGGPHWSVINFWSSWYMTLFLILILVILASFQITFSERIQQNCWTRGRGEGCSLV